MATSDQQKLDEEREAYSKFQQSLRQGQAGLDALPQDVKDKAKREAERSLEKEDRFSSFEPIPGMTPTGYEGPEDSFETIPMNKLKDPSAEGYRPVPGIAPPKEPGPSKEFMGREEYKGFRIPKELQGDPERLKAYKKAIDEREEGQSEREQGRIASASPQDQAADIIRRAAEGDPDALGDIGEVGLNIASMVGPQQVAADLSLAGIDASRGDYVGAGIGVAAAALPFVSTGMAKEILRGDYGEKAKELLMGAQDAEYRMNQELLKTKGEMVGTALEEKEEMDFLARQALKATGNHPDNLAANAVEDTSSFLRRFLVEDESATKVLDLLPDRDLSGDAKIYAEALKARKIEKVLSEMSDENLTDAVKSISDANIVIRRGPRDNAIFPKQYRDEYMASVPGARYQELYDEMDNQAFRAIDDAFARNHAAKNAILAELTRRADGDPAVARKFAKAISARKPGARRQLENKYLAEISLNQSYFDDKGFDKLIASPQQFTPEEMSQLDTLVKRYRLNSVDDLLYYMDEGLISRLEPGFGKLPRATPRSKAEKAAAAEERSALFRMPAEDKTAADEKRMRELIAILAAPNKAE